METKIKVNKKEKGITLVALIITIIILVILSAVSISAVYKSRIIDYAIEGTQKYATEGLNENKVLEGTESLIESVISNIKEIGEETSSEIEPTTPPEPIGLTKEELSKAEMIGKYVDYKPSGTDYTVETQYSGADSNQVFARNDDMKWRIWGVEGNKLLLISETLAGNIQLQGAEGYNNAVKILNDACSTTYGNSNYGNAIKARSINQDDIDKITNMVTYEQRKAVSSSYGNLYTPNNKNWPNIYEQELGESLDRSSQSIWYKGTTNSSFTEKYAYYGYNITNYVTQTMYDALLTNMNASSTSGTDSHTTYWVASRCVGFHIGDSSTTFNIFFVTNGKIYADKLYRSEDNSYKLDLAVRPIVEIDLDSTYIGVNGSGIDTTPYSIAKK